jgi:hypothetical protein
MIHDLFPTKVLIKDTDLSGIELKELTVAVEAIFSSHIAETGSYLISGEDTVPLFTEENFKIFPILKKLKDMFIDAFVELGSANSSKEATPETRKLIAELVDKHAGRLPLMKNGDYKQVHAHPGVAAFGIFYLTDVNNEKDGGCLILRDPSFHVTPHFTGDKFQKVETKAGRMIVAPTHLWHEVTPYSGNEDRITIVSNLGYMQEKYASIF